MDKQRADQLDRFLVGRKLGNLPEEISKMLIGKGLTLAQAEAVLERAKDLLRNAVI